MVEWIEVPAHRIYVISAHELRDGFDYIWREWEGPRRAQKFRTVSCEKDGKLFKWVRFANIWTRSVSSLR